MMSREVKRELYERVVISSVGYDSETWSLDAHQKRKVEVFQMICYKYK